jgi:hypothetical protein
VPLQFFEFYQTTIDKWWGRPYLKREFFHRIGADMGDEVLLVIAEEEGETVAAALNLIGRYVTSSCDVTECQQSMVCGLVEKHQTRCIQYRTS